MPSLSRPYVVIPHYANSRVVTIVTQLYRFTVTGPSSRYAFALMSTNAPSSSSLSVLPHIHRTQYLISHGYGPKYLSSQHGYQVIEPLVAPKQAHDTNYILSTISTSRQRKQSPLQLALADATAFEVLEDVLSIKFDGYPEAQLHIGDVALIPAPVPFTYYNDVPFTKILYVSSGIKGMDQELISSYKSWDFVISPKY